MKASSLPHFLVLVLPAVLCAGERTFTAATAPPVINHWPGADGLIGTAADPVNSGTSLNARSSPNSPGSYSFIVTSLGFGGPPDPLLFGSFDTITFVEGMAVIDTDAFIAPNVPMLNRLEFSGTELFPGHGAYSVRLTNPRAGTYTRTGHVVEFDTAFDFEGTFAAGMAMDTNATATGKIALLDAADFAAPSLAALPADLAAYVQNTAIPLAQSRSASGLLCGRMNLVTAGSEPGAGLTGFFPPLNAQGVVLALEFAPPADFRITAVQKDAAGVRLFWREIAGRTYTVEWSASLAAPWLPLASGLAGTEFLDTTPPPGRRFYRVKLEP